MSSHVTLQARLRGNHVILSQARGHVYVFAHVILSQARREAKGTRCYVPSGVIFTRTSCLLNVAPFH